MIYQVSSFWDYYTSTRSVGFSFYYSFYLEITESLMAAQAFVFFAAGFETSSTAISFALQELAHNPEIQERLIDEISDTLRDNDGKLSYEAVNEMKYLDMVIQGKLDKTNLLRHCLIILRATQT